MFFVFTILIIIIHLYQSTKSFIPSLIFILIFGMFIFVSPDILEINEETINDIFTFDGDELEIQETPIDFGPFYMYIIFVLLFLFSMFVVYPILRHLTTSPSLYKKRHKRISSYKIKNVQDLKRNESLRNLYIM